MVYNMTSELSNDKGSFDLEEMLWVDNGHRCLLTAKHNIVIYRCQSSRSEAIWLRDVRE